MNKGILVTDMPKTCYDCELADDDGFCYWVDKYIDHYDVCKEQRYPTCPLVPIPEKITDIAYPPVDTSELDYATGWNACIDAIMGRYRVMVEISLCERDNFCVDCDDKECWHAGQIEADCPKWRCDYPSHECENCEFLKEYKKYYKADERRKNKMSKKLTKTEYQKYKSIFRKLENKINKNKEKKK